MVITPPSHTSRLRAAGLAGETRPVAIVRSVRGQLRDEDGGYVPEGDAGLVRLVSRAFVNSALILISNRLSATAFNARTFCESGFRQFGADFDQQHAVGGAAFGWWLFRRRRNTVKLVDDSSLSLRMGCSDERPCKPISVLSHFGFISVSCRFRLVSVSTRLDANA